MKERLCSVTIIGAGAAGIGLGAIFEKAGFKDYVILEKDTIGSSFKSWPSYMRFISPSFTGNSFKALDLNAITPDTSPAFTLKTEHPSGSLYAEYLGLVADYFKVNIEEGKKVYDIESSDNNFIVYTEGGDRIKSRFVVWAGGEFNFPNMPSFPGSDKCIHSSSAFSVDEDEVVIIGGFESGMELAVHLLSENKKVTIIDRSEPWKVSTSDSSLSLAPYTLDRIGPYWESDRLKLIGNSEVKKVTFRKDKYVTHTKDGKKIESKSRPILATGFKDLPDFMNKHFSRNPEGCIDLTNNDESIKVKNLFLVGPKVRHDAAIFCFIYKFRQRLPIVFEVVAERMGLPKGYKDVIEEYKNAGMYMDDLSCCSDECIC